MPEYHTCAKSTPSCKGLKSGISGYHACARTKLCGKKNIEARKIQQKKKNIITVDTLTETKKKLKKKELTELQKKQLKNEQINLIEEEKTESSNKLRREMDQITDKIITEKDDIIKSLKQLKKTDINKFKEQKKTAGTKLNDLLKDFHNQFKLLSNKHKNNKDHIKSIVDVNNRTSNNIIKQFNNLYKN